MHVNGVLQRYVVPALPRPGIEFAGIEKRHCGFHIEFDTPLSVGDVVSLRDEEGRELPTSPTVATASQPFHFVSAYEGMVDRTFSEHPPQAAAELVVGGGTVEVAGGIQLCMLLRAGLAPGQHVIEVGCGFGRLAKNLLLVPEITYIGTDVSSKLLEYARELCASDRFRFERVTTLRIPAPAASADLVCAFSVFTHLLIECQSPTWRSVVGFPILRGRALSSLPSDPRPVHRARRMRLARQHRSNRPVGLRRFVRFGEDFLSHVKRGVRRGNACVDRAMQ